MKNAMARRGSTFAGAALVVALAPGCSSQSSGNGNTDSGGDGAGGSSSGGAALKWYLTCGDPVCQVGSLGEGGSPGDAGGPTDDAGNPCPAVGSSCSMPGQSCGTSNPAVNCGATEQCASTDPTRRPGGCPISSRRFKDDIRYVDMRQLQRLHDDVLHMRLATYRYKPEVADPEHEHLGFIIEDTAPDSPAVDGAREHVDLYGYMSMMLATLQVQEDEIAELRRELSAANESVASQPAAGSCREK
jgi:hypothetical protein